MPFEPTNKEHVLESLMEARRHGQLAELSLRFQNKPDDANKIWEGNTRLSTEIDILIGRMMDEWAGRADTAITGLAAANAKLEAAVGDIKKRIKIAQNVVTVVGVLDDAVAIARKVLAAV